MATPRQYIKVLVLGQDLDILKLYIFDENSYAVLKDYVRLR